MQKFSYFVSKTFSVLLAVWLMLVLVFAAPVQATSRTWRDFAEGRTFYSDSVWNFERDNAAVDRIAEFLPKLEALRVKMVAAGMLEDRSLSISFNDIENSVSEAGEWVEFHENKDCKLLGRCYSIQILAFEYVTPDMLVAGLTKLTELHTDEVLRIDSLDYELKNELQVRDLMEEIEPTKFRITMLVLAALALISFLGAVIFLVNYSKKHYIK